MPKPYSDDLRSRFIKLVKERGLSLIAASKQLDISYGTGKNWMARFKSCGNVSARKGYHNGHSHSISNLEEFRKMVDKYPDMTSEELAKKWGNISATTIRSYLKKIGYTRKKNFYLLRTQIKNKKSISR